MRELSVWRVEPDVVLSRAAKDGLGPGRGSGDWKNIGGGDHPSDHGGLLLDATSGGRGGLLVVQSAGHGLPDQGSELSKDPGHEVTVVDVGGGGGLGGHDALNGGGDIADDLTDQRGSRVAS